MINFSNVNALAKGRGRGSYGFFDSAKKSGAGLSSEEHDRRLKLREEAYEMRRQRGQARKFEDRLHASQTSFADRRREATAKIGDDITRMRAVHPVKLELDRDSHAQALQHKSDFHKQALGYDRQRADQRLQVTQATDAYKLQHEVRRAGVKAQIADAAHTQRMGHRGDTHRQALGQRAQLHAQRLSHFEDQVNTGMRRRITEGLTVKAPTAKAPLAAPAQPASPAPQTASVPHPSPRGKPRRQAATPTPSPAPQPASPAASKPASQPASQPDPQTFSPKQVARMDDAVGDIRKSMPRPRRSSFDPGPATPVRPATTTTPQPATGPTKPASPSSPTRLPQARAGIKLPGAEMFEHVSGRFSWDKRTVREKLKTQLPGERIETRDESSARIKRRRGQ